MLILTFIDNEEKAIEKVIAALANEIEFEVLRSVPTPMLSFSGLEIRQHQRWVLRNGMDISLTRLEYNTLVFLASSPNKVFKQSQIFEAVWNLDSDICQSSVVNVIYNLRKKIEADSKNPTYLKTVLGIGYKYSADSIGSDIMVLVTRLPLVPLQGSLTITLTRLSPVRVRPCRANKREAHQSPR